MADSQLVRRYGAPEARSNVSSTVPVATLSGRSPLSVGVLIVAAAANASVIHVTDSPSSVAEADRLWAGGIAAGTQRLIPVGPNETLYVYSTNGTDDCWCRDVEGAVE